MSGTVNYDDFRDSPSCRPRHFQAAGLTRTDEQPDDELDSAPWRQPLG
jgi:hypothetical protein